MKLQEKEESLWLLTFSPSIWALHFLLSYITAAIYCAKYAPPDGSLGPVRIAVGVYTVLALAGIGMTAWIGYRKHSFGGVALPHNRDTSADRFRFIGFATVLLSGLSAVATIFVALAAVFIGDCN